MMLSTPNIPQCSLIFRMTPEDSLDDLSILTSVCCFTHVTAWALTELAAGGQHYESHYKSCRNSNKEERVKLKWWRTALAAPGLWVWFSGPSETSVTWINATVTREYSISINFQEWSNDRNLKKPVRRARLSHISFCSVNHHSALKIWTFTLILQRLFALWHYFYYN